MKMRFSFLYRRLAGFIFLLLSPALMASPLTWFPGPALDEPTSGAATVSTTNLGNVIIGGESDYTFESFPERLIATNLYWTAMPAFYGANIAPGAIASGGMIIIYGGSDGTNSTSDVFGYSPSGDTPQTYPSMSVARSYLGYAADRSGNGYAIGGLDDAGVALASAEKLNPDSAGSWSHVASLPSPRYNFPAVFDHTNSIYIFGGYIDAVNPVETASVLRYSVSKNTWTNMAPMPVAVAGSAATIGVDGNIYVVGGFSGGVATALVQVYNPVSNAWTISIPLPEALSGASMGVDSLGRLIVMGGSDSDGNPLSDVWRSQQFGVPDSAPILTEYPATNGVYSNLYTSSISATGNPQPTYLLISGPAGMQVDAYTGAITWTPLGLDNIGDVAVTIRATNYAGYVDWPFTITIPNPPPFTPTNFQVVAVTQSSVTFSWSPESAEVGSTIYTISLKHVVHSPRGSGATVWYTALGSVTNETTMTISGLQPGLAQSYYLSASSAGGASGYTAVAATTLSVQPPPNLRVTGLTSTSISLAWDAPPGAVPAVSYEVWGWINGGTSSTSYGIVTNTSITINGLFPGSVHEWGVRAYDAGGHTSGFDYGPTVMNPIPVAPIASVTTPSSLPGQGFQITGALNNSSPQTVVIQASTNPADPASWVEIGSFLTTNSPFTFTDTNAAQYSARFYRILAP